MSKVGETPAQIDVLDFGLCNSRRVPEHYRAATADLGSAFPSSSPSLPDTDLSALHHSRVQSLLSSVVGNPPAARLCNPIVAMTFPADG